MKKLLVITLILILSAALFACGNEKTPFLTEETDGGVKVVGYEGEDTDVVIPAKINGKAVVSVARNAFLENYGITSVKLEEGIKEIGPFAFKLCVSLENISLPQTLEKIGDGAFSDCRKLKEVALPGGVSEVGTLAFSGCFSLRGFSVGEGDGAYMSDEYGVLFTRDGKTLVAFPPSGEYGGYEVPEGVCEIAANAFYGAGGLRDVAFPQTLVKIGGYAFFQSGVREIVMPDLTEEIGNFAFSESSAESVRFGNKVVKIGTHAFDSCGGLREVYISSSVKEIGADAFYRCALEKLEVDKDNADFCSDGYGVLFNKDMTELIRYPNASAETEYAVPATVRSIAPHAFSSTVSLEKVTLPDALSSFGANAFAYCISLKETVYSGEKTDAYNKMFEND